MPIKTVVPPPINRGGCRVRLSDEDIALLVTEVRAGRFATDGEPVAKKTGAYQRGSSARLALFKAEGIKPSDVIVQTWKTDEGWVWAIGPKTAPLAQEVAADGPEPDDPEPEPARATRRK